MHDSMASRKDVKYSPYNEAQRAELRNLVASFLASPPNSDSIEPLDLMSVRHMREILMCCRELHNNGSGGGSGATRAVSASARGVDSGAPGENKSHNSVIDGARAAAAAAMAAAAAADAGSRDFVGEDDAESTGQAGGVGVAPDDARPSTESDAPEAGGGAAVMERLLSMQQQSDSGGNGQTLPADSMSPKDRYVFIVDIKFCQS